MTLASELENLQRQRREEIRTLHQTYLRTKRTVVRTAGPSRIIRKHMGLSLGIAATLGLLLAPRPSANAAAPSPAGPTARKSGKSGGVLSHLGWLKSVVAKVAPQAAGFIPDAPPPEPETSHEHAGEYQHPSQYSHEPYAPPPPPPRSHKKSFFGRIIRTAIQEAGALALSKVDFHKLMTDVMKRVVPPPGQDESPNDTEPQVSVADVGTVKAHDYENFQ